MLCQGLIFTAAILKFIRCDTNTLIRLLLIWFQLAYLVDSRFPFPHLNVKQYFTKYVPQGKSCAKIHLKIDEIVKGDDQNIYGFPDYEQAIRCVTEKVPHIEISFEPNRLFDDNKLNRQDLRIYIFKKRPHTYLALLERQQSGKNFVPSGEYGAERPSLDSPGEWAYASRGPAEIPEAHEFVSFTDAAYRAAPIRLDPNSDYLLCLRVPDQWPLKEEHCKGIMIDIKSWRTHLITQYFRKLKIITYFPGYVKRHFINPVTRFGKKVARKIIVAVDVKPFIERFKRMKFTKKQIPRLTSTIKSTKTTTTTSAAKIRKTGDGSFITTWFTKKSTKGTDIFVKIRVFWVKIKAYVSKKAKLAQKTLEKRYKLLFVRKTSMSKNSIAWVRRRYTALQVKFQSKNWKGTYWKAKYSPILWFYKYLHSAATCIFCYPYGYMITKVTRQIYQSTLTIISRSRSTPQKWITGKSKECIPNPPPSEQSCQPKCSNNCEFVYNRQTDPVMTTALSRVKMGYGDGLFTRLRSWLQSWFVASTFIPKIFRGNFEGTSFGSQIEGLLTCNSAWLIVLLLLLNLNLILAIFYRIYF